MKKKLGRTGLLGLCDSHTANTPECTCKYISTLSDTSLPSYTITTSGTTHSFTSAKERHFYVPEVVFCDSIAKVTVVKWLDGTETKVTSDAEDAYSPEGGFYAALAIKVFGGNKKKFKDFWFPLISRRIMLDGKKLSLPYGRWEKQRKQEKAKRKAEKLAKLKLKIKNIKKPAFSFDTESE